MKFSTRQDVACRPEYTFRIQPARDTYNTILPLLLVLCSRAGRASDANTSGSRSQPRVPTSQIAIRTGQPAEAPPGCLCRSPRPGVAIARFSTQLESVGSGTLPWQQGSGDEKSINGSAMHEMRSLQVVGRGSASGWLVGWLAGSVCITCAYAATKQVGRQRHRRAGHVDVGRRGPPPATANRRRRRCRRRIRSPSPTKSESRIESTGATPDPCDAVLC